MNAVPVRGASRTMTASEGAATLMERCATLAKITERPGEILRTFLSPAMDEVHRVMRPWMEAAGMAVNIDRAGNLRGLYPAEGTKPEPRLLIGSHLDTVPNAGAYDGVLGVLMGLSLVEALRGRKLPFAIEVIGFSDEEGTRFGAPFLGSRATVGELDDALLHCADDQGVTVADALRDFAAGRPETIDPKLAPHCRAYLEFHIEQGPVLEGGDLALGIVEGLAGQGRAEVVFCGRAGHAGTVPMHLRRDALAAAAEWMTQVESIAKRHPGTVATVGEISAEPGGVNVIPGVVRCSLDVRHAEDKVREAALLAMFEVAGALALRRGIEVETNQYHVRPAVRFDSGMVRLAERAVSEAGFSTIRLTGGAGHDAMVIAPHVPSAMIFLRNPGGISHHPDESVAQQDVAAALHAGLCFLEGFAAQIQEKEGKSA